MPAPVYGDVGAANGATTSSVTPLPAGVSPGNPMLCVCETDDETVATPSGWAAGPFNPQTTSTTQLSLFLRRYQAGDSGPAFAAPADHLISKVFFIDDYGAVGDPLTPNASSGDAQTTTTTAVSVPGLTATTVDDCLVLMFCCQGTDSLSQQFSGWANGSLSGVAELFEGGTLLGGGGGFGVASGVKAIAGAVSATTATLATGSRQGRICLAFAPVIGKPSPRRRRRTMRAAPGLLSR